MYILCLSETFLKDIRLLCIIFSASSLNKNSFILFHKNSWEYFRSSLILTLSLLRVSMYIYPAELVVGTFQNNTLYTNSCLYKLKLSYISKVFVTFPFPFKFQNWTSNKIFTWGKFFIETFLPLSSPSHKNLLTK